MRRMIYLLYCLVFAGCNYLDDYSQDLVIAKKVADLDEVLLGSAYLRYGSPDNLAGGDVGWWLHLLDDDVNGVIATYAHEIPQYLTSTYYGYFCWQWEVGRNYAKTSLNSDAGLWKTLYNRINVANIILSEIDEVSRETEEDELDAWRVKGEAYFLRAQFYLFLVNVYGDAYAPATAAGKLGVPLKLTEYVEHDPNKSAQFERASVARIYGQIVKDLTDAVACFEQGSKPKSVYRASHEAALLLLSRVYLYMQDWENARDKALAFLDLKDHLTSYLYMDSTVVVTPKSQEVVFTQGVQNLKHAISGRGGSFCVTEELYASYDTTDARRNLYFTLTQDSIGLGFKYDTGSDPSYTGDLFLLRTPEGYLNLAEAYAMLGEAGNASKYLNELRKKRIVGYREKVFPANEIIEEVRKERRRELCFEGHRWFDLRRYAVCEKAPYKRVIEHVFPLYDSENRNLFKEAEKYRLEEDDLAYTFALPKEILEFDPGMPDNPREIRKLTEIVLIDEE